MPTALGETPSKRRPRWKGWYSGGYRDVVDADLADDFGSIPHTDLLKSVARRIVDRRVASI